jgi:hypothetical protein
LAYCELQRIYDQRSHIPARFHDLTWTSWFRINSRMVLRLKVGRLLLGGDAAHIHSPAGAQGIRRSGLEICFRGPHGDNITISELLARLAWHAIAACLDNQHLALATCLRGINSQ